MRRFLSILLLLQQSIWLMVVVPGHQRGLVQVAGTTSPDSAAACCHPSKAQQAAADREADGPTSPCCPDPLKRQSCCAVCHIALRMVVAAPPDLAPRPTGLLGKAVQPADAAPISLPLILPYDSTGPPAVA